MSKGTFILFLGVYLSVASFPVLARILAELKLINSDIGKVAMSSKTRSRPPSMFFITCVDEHQDLQPCVFLAWAHAWASPEGNEGVWRRVVAFEAGWVEGVWVLEVSRVLVGGVGTPVDDWWASNVNGLDDGRLTATMKQRSSDGGAEDYGRRAEDRKQRKTDGDGRQRERRAVAVR